jgi:hypothetical protein
MVWINVKGLTNIPGAPKVSPLNKSSQMVELNDRKNETNKVKNALRRKYSFKAHNDKELTAKAWLYDDANFREKSRRTISLEDPKQFMISWTSYGNEPLNQNADEKLGAEFAEQLTDAEVATKKFWPQIAKSGTAFNLIGVLRKVKVTRDKVTRDQMPALRALFGRPPRNPVNEARAAGGGESGGGGGGDDAAWQQIESSYQKDKLYVIDLKILESLPPRRWNDEGTDVVRFNPATVTLLEMKEDKSLEPAFIWVHRPGYKRGKAEISSDTRIYSRRGSSPGAWLYALQAAKSSVTLYGIWLGHVYHWHSIPAAMQRTLQEQIKDKKHPIQMLLGLRSQHLVRFNGALLDGYFATIAPPTSIVNQIDLLKLLDNFAKGRRYSDDDPNNQLDWNGIEAKDFSSKPTAPWDLFPAARNLTHIWDLCQDFVRAFMGKYYPTDDTVRKDDALQKWMKASADSKQGNIHGLPPMDKKKALNDVLVSYIYRITAHGVSRLPRTADPWLTFVANFPPCLQREDLPSPDAALSTSELLKYLPNLRTIAEICQFYFIFVFAGPFQPLLAAGDKRDLYFPTKDGLDTPTITYQDRIIEFAVEFDKANTPPGYPPSVRENLRKQWERSIEL